MKILVVAGASGGHIFPALGFLDSLKEQDKNIETLLILPKRNTISSLATIEYKVGYIAISSIKTGLAFKNLIGIFNFLKAILQSIFILISFQPDIVVGFGSLACIPLVTCAWLFRIKTLIHEQNVLPGKANMFLAPFADRIAISFEESRHYLKNYQHKTVITGNPLRKKLKRIEKNKALEFFKFREDKFTILVMGGSLGSSSINEGFQKAVSGMLYKNNLQIIHISGANDYDSIKGGYKKLDINVRIFDFLDSMEYAYSASDLIISRSGALTITEIIFFKLPAILIPYPYAHRHQAANAQILAGMKSGVVLEDNELKTDVLKRTIEELILNPERIKIMRSQYDSIPFRYGNDLLINAALALN